MEFVGRTFIVEEVTRFGREAWEKEEVGLWGMLVLI